MKSTWQCEANRRTLWISEPFKISVLGKPRESAMALEQTLIGWTAPSSDTEQEKQERTERMIREAITAHKPFSGCQLSIYAKGSYANNTNVRADSDVDIAVECTEVEYWELAEPGIQRSGTPYEGVWTPQKLRAELGAALSAKFPGRVDASGSTAFLIKSSSARVEADVVPCFSFRYYMSSSSRCGTKIFTTAGKEIVNYPSQQLENGKAKNARTGYCFKKAVRVLKRIENAMVASGTHREVPSYLIECLAYNCPDSTITSATWTSAVRQMLFHIWQRLQGEEPTEENLRWLEVNECFYLFHPGQKWNRGDGRDFAAAAWNYLGYT